MSALMQPVKRENGRQSEVTLSDAEIMARVARIKRTWSENEKRERAETGRHRRNLLAALVESAIADERVAYAG